MGERKNKKGSVILIVVFIIALMATVVMGIAQVNTEELLIFSNCAGAAQAVEAGYAGMNDAFSELRADPNWVAGFTDKAFNGGTYSVSVSGTAPSITVSSTSQTQQGFSAKVEADVTVSMSSPFTVRVDNLRINE